MESPTQILDYWQARMPKGWTLSADGEVRPGKPILWRVRATDGSRLTDCREGQHLRSLCLATRNAAVAIVDKTAMDKPDRIARLDRILHDAARHADEQYAAAQADSAEDEPADDPRACGRGDTDPDGCGGDGQ